MVILRTYNIMFTQIVVEVEVVVVVTSQLRYKRNVDNHSTLYREDLLRNRSYLRDKSLTVILVLRNVVLCAL